MAANPCAGSCAEQRTAWQCKLRTRRDQRRVPPWMVLAGILPLKAGSMLKRLPSSFGGPSGTTSAVHERRQTASPHVGRDGHLPLCRHVSRINRPDSARAANVQSLLLCSRRPLGYPMKAAVTSNIWMRCKVAHVHRHAGAGCICGA